MVICENRIRIGFRNELKVIPYQNMLHLVSPILHASSKFQQFLSNMKITFHNIMKKKCNENYFS